MASLTKLYLVLYNALQATGWAVALFMILSDFMGTKSVNGLVRNGVWLPLMQWGGRVHFVLAIVKRGFRLLLKVIFLLLLLVWIRYTAFIVLYPIGGVLSEMRLMYQALPLMKEKNLYSGFFSSFPFSYYQFISALFLVYPFLLLKLYLHMFKQRRSKLLKLHEKKQS